MSEWCVFVVPRDEGREIHVAPCDAKGMILAPHIGTPSCLCRPRQDAECVDVWLHNDAERGGYNA